MFHLVLEQWLQVPELLECRGYSKTNCRAENSRISTPPTPFQSPHIERSQITARPQPTDPNFFVSNCNMDQPPPERMRVDIRRQFGHGVNKKLCFNYDPPHLFRRDCFWAGIAPQRKDPRGPREERKEANDSW